MTTDKTFTEVYPEVAANNAVRSLAHDLLTHGYSNEETETKVHAVSDQTGIDAAVLWDILPELCTVEADRHYQERRILDAWAESDRGLHSDRCYWGCPA